MQFDPSDPFADIPVVGNPAATDDPFADIPVTTQTAAQPAAEQPPAQSGGWGRGLKVGMQGVGRGAADLIGMPVDLMTLGLNAGSAIINKAAGTNIPAIQEPIGGSDNIANVAEKIYSLFGGDAIEYDDMSMPEKVGYNIDRYTTGAMAGPVMAGPKAVDMSLKGAKTVPRAIEGLVEPYMQNLPRAAVVDASAGAGSGVAITGAEEYFPDSPMATLLASVLGSSGGATAGGLGVSGTRGAKDIVRSLTEGYSVDRTLPRDPETGALVKRSVADRAAEYMQDSAVNPELAARNIDENAAFYAENDLPAPGSGVLSNDVGAIGIEKAARLNDPTPFLQRDRQVREAQAAKLSNVGPRIPEEQKGAAQQFAQQERDAATSAAQGKVSGAKQALTDAELNAETMKQMEAERVAPVAAARGTEGQASQALDKEIVQGALEPRTQAKNQAFDAIDPEGTVKREASSIAQLAQEINDSIGALTPESAGVPAEFMQQLKKLMPDMEDAPTGLLDETGAPIIGQKNNGGDGTVSMKDMLDARKYLNTAAERAQQAGNFTLARNIRKLKTEINAEADRLIDEGGLGAAEAAAAKKAYEEDYAPFFAQGFGRNFRDAIQKDPTGRTKMPPSETAGFFLNSSEEAAKDLGRIVKIAQNPEAAAGAVSNYMKAQIANLVKADGTLEPATLRKWMDNNAASLGNFPEAKAEIDALYKDVLNGRTQRNSSMEQVRKLANDLKAAEADATATERRMNNSVLKTLIDNDPENAAAKILADGDPSARMKETVSALKNNKEALDAFKRSVADHLESRFTGTRTEQTGTEDYAVMQSKIEAFMKKPGVQKAIEELYADTPDALNNLRLAQRIGRDVAKLNVQATAGSVTAENAARMNKFLGPVELVFKSVFGNLEGGGQMRRLKLAMQNIPGLNNDAAIQRLLVRAQLEPELAAHLFRRETNRMPDRLWSKKLHRLLGYAATSREISDTDTEE